MQTTLKRPAEPLGMSSSIRLAGVLLIVVILVSALIAIAALRSKDTEDWRRNLRSMTFMLSEHTAQTLYTAHLVLDAISERVEQSGVRDAGEFRTRLATLEMHQMMRDKIDGLPQIDVASLVATNGDNINFTRSFPIPPINLAERDYFKAHKANAQLGDYISTSVRNKGNGKWTFYISRRINDARGHFMGLVLVGLSVDAITGIYDRVVGDLGEGSGITLFRDDLTALARAPRNDEVIGRVSKSGPAYTVLNRKNIDEDVILADTPRFTTGDSELRLSAIRRVARYPLAVALVVPDSIFLASWRHTALQIGAVALSGSLFVLGGMLLVMRSVRHREQAEQELRHSETKFHTMVDWATDWEYWVRADRSIHYMTPSAEQFTGYPVSEFEHQPTLIDRVIHPDDLAHWQQHIEAVQTAPDQVSDHAIDLRIVHRNGSQRWVSHVCRPVYGEQGEYLGRRATMRDITERKTAENEIRQLAYYDALTGLPNRRLFLDRLGQARLASERSRSHGALMMLDLDHFKKLNDTQGHDVGDLLLIEVARRLTHAVRETDTVSRLGGDEFAVMLDNLGTDELHAAQLAEQVAAKIHQTLNLPFTLGPGRPEYRSSPSVGVTLFRGSTDTFETLMKQADVALYQAKDAGRNTVRFFNPAMQASIDTRIATEQALREALQHDRFELHYQPQVDADGSLIGAEALLRWHDPQQGLVLPSQFIPLAEETGLIVEIGRWVLASACAQLRRWQDELATRHLRLSVNVSARQFHQPDFVASVQRCLSESGAAPHGLLLELTESIVIERIDEVIRRMEELHRLGVAFSLDDFGTGYSSLSYLRLLPLDEIKIDQSFVRDLADDSNDAAIIKAILALSSSLGLRVIAEGVETRVQHDFLRQHACPAFQGYLYGRPTPLSQWPDLERGLLHAPVDNPMAGAFI